MHRRQHLSPSQDEVEAAFTLSLSQLLDPALAGHEDLGLRSSKAPYYLGGPAKVGALVVVRSNEEGGGWDRPTRSHVLPHPIRFNAHAHTSFSTFTAHC